MANGQTPIESRMDRLFHIHINIGCKLPKNNHFQWQVFFRIVQNRNSLKFV